MKLNKSHGDGSYRRDEFKFIGENVIIEKDVKIFHPENIILHDNVYIGHNTILKGYYKNTMEIGANTWIGQNCFFHSAGGITIAANVGIGPNVSILTSSHSLENLKGPILFQPVEFNEVVIKEGVDIGVSSTILPGVTIGKMSQIGAMTLVNKNVPELCVFAGIPGKVIRNTAFQSRPKKQ